MLSCVAVDRAGGVARRPQFFAGLLAACLSLLVANPAEAATLSNLFHFDQHVSLAGVTQGLGGDSNYLFGSTYDVAKTSGGTLFKVPLAGGAPQVIYQLTSNDGYSPRAALIASADGYLYGTTHNSQPTSTKLQSGGGTVFRIKPDGTLFQTLHDFGGATNNPTVDDSVGADFSLLEVGNDLYGVTSRGGANGTGSVFRLSKDGSSFTTLREFEAATQISSGVYDMNTGGARPSAALVLGSDGRLYGVTRYGGATRVKSGTTTVISGTGTIYSLDPNAPAPSYGFLAVSPFLDLDIAATTAVNDTGVNPAGPLVEISAGVFVGTTVTGGDPSKNMPATSGAGFGTLYQYTVSVIPVTALHSFNNTDGAGPSGQLANVGGKIYGTTSSGLSTATPAITYGGVFEWDNSNSTFTSLQPHAFATGVSVVGGVMLATDGDLYGVTTAGGACTALNGSGYGTVYRYSLTTGASSTAYANCTQPTNSGGGGGMQMGWLALFAGVGLLGVAWRRRA